MGTRAATRPPRLALVGAAALLGAALGPAADAAACSTCFTATEATREAYYGTTLLLAVLPFALAGGLGLWLRRAARRARLTRSG